MVCGHRLGRVFLQPLQTFPRNDRPVLAESQRLLEGIPRCLTVSAPILDDAAKSGHQSRVGIELLRVDQRLRGTWVIARCRLRLREFQHQTRVIRKEAQPLGEMSHRLLAQGQRPFG